MMNAEQREKALEALEKKKELDRKQHRAMAFHLMASIRYCCHIEFYMILRSRCLRKHFMRCRQMNFILLLQ